MSTPQWDWSNIPATMFANERRGELEVPISLGAGRDGPERYNPTMTDEDFIAAIANAPDDELPRLVYADWLQEQGRDTESAAMRNKPWQRCGLDAILGETIQSIHLDATGDNLSLKTASRKTIEVNALGDCCSCSWFYRLRGVGRLIGAKVVGFVEIDTSDVNLDDGLGRQEVDSVNGIGVLTSRGVFEIVYRCSSNGYYGGWLESKVVPDTSIPMGEISNDWQASGGTVVAS